MIESALVSPSTTTDVRSWLEEGNRLVLVPDIMRANRVMRRLGTATIAAWTATVVLTVHIDVHVVEYVRRLATLLLKVTLRGVAASADLSERLEAPGVHHIRCLCCKVLTTLNLHHLLPRLVALDEARRNLMALLLGA